VTRPPAHMWVMELDGLTQETATYRWANQQAGPDATLTITRQQYEDTGRLATAHVHLGVSGAVGFLPQPGSAT